MCHRRRGWHSVSSFCFAVLTQADEHPRVGNWLVGIVVVGKELLSELTLVGVVRLKKKKRLFEMLIVWRQRQNKDVGTFLKGDFKSALFIVIIIKQLLSFWLLGCYCTGAVSDTFYTVNTQWNEWCEHGRTQDTRLWLGHLCSVGWES